MRSNAFGLGLSVALALSLAFPTRLAAQSAEMEPIPNWTAPPFWTPPHSAAIDRLKSQEVMEPLAAEALPTGPLPFFGIAPCRLLDTRNNLNPLGGGGPYAVNETRTYTLSGNCGLPAGAEAVSLNVTVTNTGAGAFGHIKVWPADQAEPSVSTLNYPGAGATLANAAVVPLSATGALKVKSGNAGADVILDVNGYYAPISIVNSVNGQSGAVTIATLPAGSAGQTLRHNGSAWVANSALTSDGTKVSLTGELAFPSIVRVTSGGGEFLHNYGIYNAFVGYGAGNSYLTGTLNTAVGYLASSLLTSGSSNTAIGYGALNNNNAGSANTAAGRNALVKTLGNYNTAFGSEALFNNTSGASNIALGYLAGTSLTSGSNNMYLGNEGVASESNTIRLGSGLAHSRLFLAGVLGTNIGSGSAMYISGSGQVGTVLSSARYKEDIQNMGGASDRLLKLRPVTFRYKGHADDSTQFGLIAEEVEKVFPELVLHDSAGRPETVMYHELPAMLVNELQKQQREIAELKSRLETLEALLAASASK